MQHGSYTGTVPFHITTLRDNRVEQTESLIVKATSISGPNAGTIRIHHRARRARLATTRRAFASRAARA